MKGQKPLMSSVKQDWGTPQAFIEWLESAYQFKFELDVCAHEGNFKVPNYFNEKEDCLTTEWFGRHVWMNPPFGRQLPKFINRAIGQIEKGNVGNVWILVPARTCTKWAYTLCNHKTVSKILFIKGRLNFDFERNLKGANAPFPSMLIHLKRFNDWDGVSKGSGFIRKPTIKFIEIPKEARGFN